MAERNFTIDQVGWHTRVKGNPETREHIERRMRALFGFLDRNGLLQANAPRAPSHELGDDFRLESQHLTERGLALVRRAYQPWLEAVDKGTSPENVSILENALAQMPNGA